MQENLIPNTGPVRMKRRDWAMIVCVAIVDAPRIIDSYIGLHGDKVHWELWPAVHGLTGLGMACIAGLSIAQCLSALAPGRATENNGTRNLLMVLTVAAILALGLQVLPPLLGAPADGLWRVVWAVSAVASPLLVVAATPVAHTLEQAQNGTQEAPHGPDAAEVGREAARGAVDGLRAEFAIREELHERRIAELHDRHEMDIAVLQDGLQVLANARPVQAPAVQIASPDASLQVAIAELQGTPLAKAVPALVKRGFTKAAIAGVLGKPAYALSDNRISKTEVL